MSFKLSKSTFKELIQEDINFILKYCPATLERSHVINVLNDYINKEYPKNTALGGLNSNPLNIMSKVRAKFKCYSVEEFAGGSKTAKLSAVYSEKGENAQFAHATPSGNLSISIDSQTEAVNFFKAGEEYYLDFSLVPKAVAE